MLVLEAVVVVDVDLRYARAEGGDGFRDADGHGCVAEVEADADLIQVAKIENFDEVRGGGGFAEQVFDQRADAERTGEGAQVFEAR